MNTTPGVLRVTDFDTIFDYSSRAIVIAGSVVIEDLDEADGATFAFASTIAPGNSTPAVISFHPTSGRIAGI